MLDDVRGDNRLEPAPRENAQASTDDIDFLDPLKVDRMRSVFPKKPFLAQFIVNRRIEATGLRKNWVVRGTYLETGLQAPRTCSDM